jgi:UDP-glucuronate decarboxylase
VEFTIAELVAVVLYLTGSSSKAVHKALPQDDPRRRRADISRATAGLDSTPRTPLEEGLGHTITSFEGAGAARRPAPAREAGRLLA